MVKVFKIRSYDTYLVNLITVIFTNDRQFIEYLGVSYNSLSLSSFL